ncbi:MAG TPA: RNA polymerase sigma factor [candidate division Zixibacteria bacterium]|nr:RNA polymerase sigma factor [candidate division Zixibacteria bacterium]
MSKKIGEESSRSSVNHTDSSADDRALIFAAADGDKNAYGKLVIKYQKRLFRFILMMLGEKDMTEDVVQEAFVKGYLALGSFEPERPFYPWIATIARNLTLNLIKKEGREKPASDYDDLIASLPDSSTSPLDRIIDRENDRHFAEAVKALPPPYRAVFVMRMFEKKSYEQIGRELNISPGTVDSRLYRARQKLLELLKDYL